MAPASKPRTVLLAIDQGTTGTKALLLDSRLRVLAEESREFPQSFPRPGWVEHDLDEIHASVRHAVEGALASSGVAAREIAAIGIANQRETTAVWDKRTGKPVYPAIVWQDRRTAETCAELRRRGLEGTFRLKTGLVLDPYFSGTKVAWILENVPGARRAARSGRLLFGTVDTYLVWCLTAGESHVTDVSNASRTLLMDLRSTAWSDEILGILGIPPSMLPEIRDNDRVFGRTRDVGWLPDGIPIATVLGDQQAALFGQACFSVGEAKCTYGTGAFLVAQTGEKIVRSRHGLVSTAAWRRGGKTHYAVEGSTFVAGAVVQWLRDGLGIIRSSGEVEALARRVEDSGGVVFVPAFTGLGAPHWNPQARGLICGLTRGTTSAHIARAALEGIAFQIRDLVACAVRDTGRSLKALKVDGGAVVNDLLMQFQADILGLDVLRPRFTSTTALGAGAMAGLTTGVFSSEEEIRRTWKLDRRFRPRMKPGERSRRERMWEEALRRVRT